MEQAISLDQLFLHDRNSVFIIRLTGKKQRLGLCPGDKVIVNRALPFQINRPALVVIKGKFEVQIVTQEFLDAHEPEAGNFIWGMIQTIIRELA
jgi:hypothetical protein